ncbi:MAG TPA: DNA-binding response regulator [Rheinheimera sp.]|nr:DNA-binding response regulator [Rheinheimera sp.]
MSIRIAVIDDQTLVRQGIISLLQLVDDFSVVAQAGDGSTIEQLVAQHSPDILLLDLQMPVHDGLATLKTLREKQLALPVLVLTTFDDHERVLNAMLLGARGYLLKDVGLEQLETAIRDIVQGGNLWQPAITQRILQHSNAAPVQRLHEALSEKELEVLRLMASGFSNREIAQAVFKSEGTVKNQVSAILTKLDVRDRTKAVLKAIDLGLLT